MKKNYGKIYLTGSMLSILLTCTATHSVFAARVDASFSGQGSAAAAATADSSATGNAGAASEANAATSGNASASADEETSRKAVQRNGSAMVKAGVSAVNSTAVGARESGRIIAQQGNRAAESATVNGDANALAGGTAMVETGDGITIDLNSVSNSTAGVAVHTENVERSGAVIGGEASHTAADVEGNAVALTETSESGTQDLLESVGGSVSASGDLSAEIGAVANIQQDVTSGAQAAVEETVSETQATVEATAETAVNTAAEVTADLAADAQSETDATLEEAQNNSESAGAEAMGGLDFAGAGSGAVEM